MVWGKGEGREIREKRMREEREEVREAGVGRVRKERRIGAGFRYPLLGMLTTSQQHHRAGD